MGDFLNSKLMKDLQNGVLPPVEVGLDTASLIKLALCLFLAGLAIILAFHITKNLSN